MPLWRTISPARYVFSTGDGFFPCRGGSFPGPFATSPVDLNNADAKAVLRFALKNPAILKFLYLQKKQFLVALL
jgi:hypothetical protein